MSESNELPEGWGRPVNSSKHHYFKERRSVCGKWMYFSNDLEPDSFESPDDCRACRKKINAKKDARVFPDKTPS